jgi:hypothetical protein
MPEHISYQALAALLLLLPGFLTAELSRTLATRPERTEFDKVVEALSYSLLNYAIFAAFGGKFPLGIRVESTGKADLYSLDIHPLPILGLVLISAVVSVVVAYIINQDFFLPFLRRLRITQRTLRVSVWNDTFYTFSGYVQVELADGRQVIGYLRFYSDTPQEASLFLEDAAWRNDDGTPVEIDGPGILLTKDVGIRTVMFLNPDPRSSEPLGYKEV